MLHTKGAKPLRIIFHKLVEYTAKYDKTRYIALFNFAEKCEKRFDRISYLIMLKSNISGFYSHKYTKMEINSNDYLHLEKTNNMDNVIILFKFVLTKTKTIIIMKCSKKNVCINNI